MGFEELIKTVNEEMHSVRSLSEMKYFRKTEARAAIGPMNRKCLRNTYISEVDNDLHGEPTIPETQKLKDVVRWTEILLQQTHIGDSVQESRTSFLDFFNLKESVQNSRGTESINKGIDNVDLKLVHSNDLYISEVFEKSSKSVEGESPGTPVNSNVLCFPSKTLHSIQTVKHGKESWDAIISTNIWGECVIDDPKHRNIRKNHFQTTCQPVVDLHKNESYFGAPLSDSSDEEWSDMRKNSQKWPPSESRGHKKPADRDDFGNPRNMRCFGLPMTETRHSKRMPGGCEKWSLVTEIQEYECENFTQSPKCESFSGTQDSIKINCKETKNGNFSFRSKSRIKKDVLRSKRLEPLKKASDQRGEPRSEHTLEIDEISNGNKNPGEQSVTSNRANCKKDQEQQEIMSLLEYPVLQTESYSKNLLLNPPENITSEIGSDDLNLCHKSTNKSNGDPVSLVRLSQFCDDRIACKPSVASRYEQGTINQNISNLKSVEVSKSGTEESLTALIKPDGLEEPLWNNSLLLEFNPNDSVLAKYYFYLNYLNKSKRFKYENGGDSFPCQEQERLKEANAIKACCCRNDSLNEQHTNVHQYFGTSEVGCCCSKTTHVIKLNKCSEERKLKPLLANSTPEQRKMEKIGSVKDPEVFERKTSTKPVGPMRDWEKASISWSAYTHGKLRPSKSCMQRSAPGKKLIKKGLCNFQSCPSSGTESREQYESAPQICNKLNTKQQSDCNLTPWLLLPDELWLCIFSLLTHKDISQISQVCHHFYQLAKDKSLWKTIQLKDCHCLNDDWLISLGKRHPECFTLDHCHDKDERISEVGLKQFFQYCKESLKELNVKYCSGSGFKGDRVLLHASIFCHNLTAVDISWTGATDSGLIAVVNASRSLQCLSANGCQVTNHSLTALTEKHGKSLKKLEIFGCYAVTDKSMKSVPMNCPNLEVLNIGRVHRITEDCLTKMVNSLEKLTSLNLTGLSMITDCLVHFILKKCPKLENLVFNSCSHVTDISLIEISTYVPMIRYLDVNGCKDVTDTGVQALAGNCHKLSYLDLSSTATSKRGVALLANFCFRTLECLKLSFCKNITPDAVAKLCKHCKRQAGS